MSLGATPEDSLLLANCINSNLNSLLQAKPLFSETKAFTTSIAILSGIPITPASATASCSINVLSTSNGLTKCPAVFMTSSDLPWNQKKPSSSINASSPVIYQPFLNLELYLSSFFQ